MRGDEPVTASDAGDGSSSPFAGKVPIRVALNELRLRLLDLSGRNRLVNFRHTAGKSLQFVSSSIDATFRRLTAEPPGKVAIVPLAEPERRDWIARNGRQARPEPKDHAVRVGIDPSYDLLPDGGRAVAAPASGSQVRTLFYSEDLGRHCRKLEREAKLAIEETGANMLYLVLGFLEFPEAPNSDKLFRAPLLCVPVSLSKADERQYTSFFLSYTGDELAENLSLREKLKRDFGLNLPEYDPDEESSPEDYFERVADAVASLPNWRVRRMMTLTLLSFANMLLVRDLDPENWPKTGEDSALLSHPIVRQVFEGRPASEEAQYAEEYCIDEHPGGDLPLVYDADSSQHSALIDVLDGRNRVVEGPPGTGKSQTITNLIAAALATGKKVLFVAEKLAALEVVKTRLTLAGLDPFVLELHSNKTSKKRVLEDLAARIGMRSPAGGDLPNILEQQKAKRQELKAYAELVNSRFGNALDLTLHQVMWRAERHRLQCGDCAPAVQELGFPPAARTSSGELAAIRDRLRYLAQQLGPIGAFGPGHPLWGFFPAEFKPEDDLPVKRTLEEFAARFERFASAASDAAALLGGANLRMSSGSADQLLSVLGTVTPAEGGEIDFAVLPALFPHSDPDGRQTGAVLSEVRARQTALAEAEEKLRQHLLSSEPCDLALAETATGVLAELKAFGLAACDQSRLEGTKSTLLAAVEDAVQAIGSLNAVSVAAGLPFDGSHAAVQRLRALTACVQSAPTSVLHLRHEGLRAPRTAEVLKRAHLKLQGLQEEQARLGAALYTDLLPSDGELKEAIVTLREGNAWYRIFQPRWRKAVGLHRRLERSKTRRPCADRLADLESVVKNQALRKEWQSDATLRTAAGTHFDGVRTPLEQLAECAQWVERATAALEAADVPLDLFDPLGVERPTLARLAGQAPVVEAAVAALDRFSAAVDGLLNGALPGPSKDLRHSDWALRIRCAARAVEQIKRSERIMGTAVRPGSSAEDGLGALIVSHDFVRWAAEFEEMAKAKQLLGDRFRGRSTILEPMLAAHAYGTLVKAAGLPAAVEGALISDRCVSNHARLKALTEGILSGWRATSDFAAAMGRFGPFEPAQWVDPTDKSTSEYARTLAEKTRHAATRVGGLLPWAQYLATRKEVNALGLEGFVKLLEDEVVPTDKLEDAFAYRFYACIAQGAFDTSPVLRQFSGLRHSSIRDEFAELDREVIGLRGKQVSRECLRRSGPPTGNAGVRVDEKTEMRLLEHLIPQQRPRVPVRQMLRRAGRAIQELKPCFMMGPQAVAQFLEPGRLHFDIVVMDEASQLRPEEAVGAIARGSQLVVVGDPKQLPPTSFFSRMAATEADDDGMGQMATSEAESILDVCISHFQPVRTLRWHYRSQHESLIAFSNHYFYRGNLVVFPSPFPKSKALGVRYEYVADGVYESQMNHVEARRVVDAVVEHVLHRPGDSLGLVTLNIKQRDLVAEMLDERLRSLPQAAAFRERWDAKGMGLFVKNLENVQGDERDCILISTTFGKPSGANVVRQNFGPISREGGWRRLNVLFTRARKSVAVFSSMRPEDIVVDSSTPEGTRALRNYLEFARTGVLPLERETGLPPDSDFEIAVMDVLRGAGYEVTPQLGVAGFRIDIAVRHPLHRSGYLAAVECDGASYHSGVSVRDRDRIRQEILESLGWKGRIWRIWSTDWFRSPLGETQKLLAYLDGLRDAPVPDEFLVDEVSGTGDSPDAEPPDGGGEPCEEGAQTLIIEDEDDELEIDVGDLVSYSSTASPESVMRVRITSNRTDPAQGLVAENTPLGSVLMGATVGETVVLRVPGRSPQSFVIVGIKRAPSLETA